MTLAQVHIGATSLMSTIPLIYLISPWNGDPPPGRAATLACCFIPFQMSYYVVYILEGSYLVRESFLIFDGETEQALCPWGPG